MIQNKAGLFILLLLLSLIINVSCGDAPEKKERATSHTIQQAQTENKQDSTSQRSTNGKMTYFADLMDENHFTIPTPYQKALLNNPKLLQYNIKKHNKPKSISHHPLIGVQNTISFQNIHIGQRTQLQVGIGTFIGDQPSDGILFRISLRDNGAQNVIFEETLAEFNVWKEYVMDLSRYEGKKVTIEFTTEPGDSASYDQAVWGSPRILAYADYEAKDIASAEQHPAIIANSRDIQLASTEHRVDRGWFAGAITTDILLPDIPMHTILRNELYVVSRSSQKLEVLKLELLDDNNNVLTASTHSITTRNQAIFDEYTVDKNTANPVKVRVTLDSENPSKVFIKEPMQYVRRDEQAAPPQHNVILISLDTLRPDRLGCYGYSRDTSPHIDALATESFVFTNAYSNSNWTLPAHVSMFTSLYPSQHQIVLKNYYTFNFYSPEWPYYYITEAFKEAKYVTLAFTGGGMVAARYGFNKGFDYHFEKTVWTLQERDIQMLLDLMKMQQDNPVFLFLHTYEIHEYHKERPQHYDYVSTDFQRNTILLLRDDSLSLHGIIKLMADYDTATPLFIEKFNKIEKKILPADGERYLHDLYDGAIRYTDTQLGNFFEGLKQIGMYENTWIILTSDHGEGLGEMHNNNQTRSWLHGPRLYDEQIRIPLIIKPPHDLMRTFSPDHTLEEFVQIIDIPPTLLAILGLKPHQQFAGSDLSVFFTNSDPSAKEPIFANNLERGHIAVINNRYKLITKFTPRAFSAPKVTHELYNLAKDTPEKINLLATKQAAKYAPVRNELRQLLDEHIRDLLPGRKTSSKMLSPITSEGTPKPENIDQEHLQHLKDLGYL